MYRNYFKSKYIYERVSDFYVNQGSMILLPHDVVKWGKNLILPIKAIFFKTVHLYFSPFIYFKVGAVGESLNITATFSICGDKEKQSFLFNL
jgi:hypothetical protein